MPDRQSTTITETITMRATSAPEVLGLTTADGIKYEGNNVGMMDHTLFLDLGDAELILGSRVDVRPLGDVLDI